VLRKRQCSKDSARSNMNSTNPSSTKSGRRRFSVSNRILWCVDLFIGFPKIHEFYQGSCQSNRTYVVSIHITQLTNRSTALWQRLFEETYPVEYNDIERGNRTLPECWRTVFWVCVFPSPFRSFLTRIQSIEEERRIRLLDIEQRIRGTRAESETHKRENAIKVTAPLTKRHRPNSWGSNVAWGAPRPKTLFEKARFESKKIQKTVFGPNMTSKFSSSKAAAAVMRPAATLGMLTSGSGSGFISGKISTTESISFANPAKLKGLSSVVVKAMQQSRSQPSSSSTASPGPSSSSSTGKMTLAPSAPIAVASGLVRTYPPSQASSVSSMSPPSMSPPPSLPPKKDPLAALFMPKHKAFSQKPVAPPRQTKPIPSGTTKHNTTPIKGGTATTTPSTSPSKSQAAAASSNPPGPASTPPRATTTTTLMLPGRYTGQSPVPLPTFSGVGQSKNTVSPIHRR
jgi:elongin-A